MHDRLRSWRPRLRRGLCCLLLLCATALPAHAAKILFIATSPVPPGKFVRLAQIGAAHGITVEDRYAERIASDSGPQLFAGYDLVLFDTPRDHMRDFVQTRLAGALRGAAFKSVWLHETQPTWSGMPEALAHRLQSYYVNGSHANFEGFFETLAAWFGQRDWQATRAPIVFPKTAVYHPGYDKLVFDNPTAYFAWKGVDPAAHAPIIAIALHQQYVAAEQTAFIDALIARIEARGGVALPFYSPVLDNSALSHMVTVDGKRVADVLINTQIMLNAEGRKQEFEALGMPVIQAMPYRRGDEAAWRADPHGVQLMDVPFYLAQAEYAGVTDIQVAAATRASDEQIVAIDAQADAVVNKAFKLAALQRTPEAQKRVAIFYWNYPPGEKNLSASFMNLPRSLVGTLTALHDAGYTTETPSEQPLTLLLQRLLKPTYQPADDQSALEALWRDGLAAAFPVAQYRAWLARLPRKVQDDLRAQWGEPERSSMVLRRDGAAWFIIPRLKLGNVVLLPQPARGERWQDKEKALYHSTKAAPNHFYLATYLWVRQAFDANAVVHYGTHGTQEWLPGKERGLSMQDDYPMLAIGDVPVVYPYIVDNIGEATQAKRRGRAVIISHQTPPFAPAGLHDALVKLHDQLHAWLAQDEGIVKERIKAEFLELAKRERIDKDLGWTDERIARDFPTFIDAVHAQLHEIAHTAQPMGLHTFGVGAEEKWRIATLIMLLGRPFWESAADDPAQADEVLVGDYEKLVASKPFQLLQKHVVEGAPTDGLNAVQRQAIDKARVVYRAMNAQSETAGLLAALDGRHIPTSYGGDPIKNPDALPTGRNLYGFDPSRVPTTAAWSAGKQTFDNLLATHRAQTGQTPKKLTFTLWSVETMRHFGMLEAQALWALGVEPVWDAGGRVTDVKLVSRAALGRPRVDIVLSATGLYRDHFPNVMRLLAKAAKLAAEADEADNPVRADALRIAAALRAKGWSEEAARKAGQTRIFSSESGSYGTGLDDATLATDTWKGKADGDRKLAALYVARMQYAYGPDQADWGTVAKGVNLYAEHLKGTQGAVLSRTSNLYGMLTTDDPFQYLGGISLAVRALDGKAPELYISNLRGSGSGKTQGAAQFLANELATRNFHPGYIKGLMAEGYAGTLEVLDSMNNFWGWTAVAREIVRDDQWQEFVDVYVRDKYHLGLRQWFESKNPHALAQTIERMLEAARKDYWHADAKTVRELKERYRDLARRYDVRTDNAAFNAWVDAGYGLRTAAHTPNAHTSTAQPLAAQLQQLALPPQIKGYKLEKVSAPAAPPPLRQIFALLLLAVATTGGAWRGLHRQQT